MGVETGSNSAEYAEETPTTNEEEKPVTQQTTSTNDTSFYDPQKNNEGIEQKRVANVEDARTLADAENAGREALWKMEERLKNERELGPTLTPEQWEDRVFIDNLLTKYPETFKRVILEDGSIAAFKEAHYDRSIISGEPVPVPPMLFAENGRLEIIKAKNRQNVDYTPEELTEVLNSAKAAKAEQWPLAPGLTTLAKTKQSEYYVEIMNRPSFKDDQDREGRFYDMLDRAEGINKAKREEEEMRPEREKNNQILMEAFSERLKGLARKIKLPNGEDAVVIPQTNDIEGQALAPAQILTKGCHIQFWSRGNWNEHVLENLSLTAINDLVTNANKKKEEGRTDSLGNVYGRIEIGGHKYDYTRTNSAFEGADQKHIEKLISKLQEVEQRITKDEGQVRSKKIEEEQARTQYIVDLLNRKPEVS